MYQYEKGTRQQMKEKGCRISGGSGSGIRYKYYKCSSNYAFVVVVYY
jgi:hypothetical protein